MSRDSVPLELKKVALASVRSWTRSQTGKILYILVVLLWALVAYSAYRYQYAQLLLNQEPELKSNAPSASTATDTASRQGGPANKAEGPTWRPGATSSFIWLAVLTVLGSVLAAFIVSLLGNVKAQLQAIDDELAFRLLFSAGDGDSFDLARSIHIVVPLYLHRLPDSRGRPNDRKLKLVVGGKTRVLAQDVATVQQEDSRAAEAIRSRLVGMGFSNVRVVTDAEARVITPGELGVELLIGLRVNELVDALHPEIPTTGEETTPLHFGIVPVSRVEQEHGEFPAVPHKVVVAVPRKDGTIETDPTHSTRVMTDGEREVMLIAKVRAATNPQLIIGGLSSRATLLAAQYFANNMQRIIRERDLNSDLEVGSRVFALVYSALRTGASADCAREHCVVLRNGVQ